MPRKQAARDLSDKLGVPVTEAMLAKWATQQRGPRFAIVMGKATYSRQALDEWAAAQLAEDTPASKPRRKAA
jgi:hypothetical protein